MTADPAQDTSSLFPPYPIRDLVLPERLEVVLLRAGYTDAVQLAQLDQAAFMRIRGPRGGQLREINPTNWGALQSSLGTAGFLGEFLSPCVPEPGHTLVWLCFPRTNSRSIRSMCFVRDEIAVAVDYALAQGVDLETVKFSYDDTRELRRARTRALTAAVDNRNAGENRVLRRLAATHVPLEDLLSILRSKWSTP